MRDDELRWLKRIKPNLQRRADIYRITRTFFRELGFLEVETPVRVPCVAPELNIAPFPSQDWFLSTSPELHMKRLLAAGYERIFQIGHCFRKAERGKWHNPEFTMLEWYRAGADYQQMIKDTEQLVVAIASNLQLGPAITYRGQNIDLTPPWQRLTVREAFHKTAGWDPVANPDPLRFDTDLVTRVIPTFSPQRPTVLLDYPAPMASLARLKPGEACLAERAEVFIGGLELANAYSELTDQREQEGRFQQEMEQIRKEPGRNVAMPEKFLESLAYLPECGGIALGVDRLVMLFCDTDSIDEVVAFTVDTA